MLSGLFFLFIRFLQYDILHYIFVKFYFMIRYGSRISREVKNDVCLYRFLSLYCGVFFVMIVLLIKLFILQVLQHETYKVLASGQHEILQQLFPKRGGIYLRDSKSNTRSDGDALTPLALNKTTYELYVQPVDIKDITSTAEKLFSALSITDETEKKNILEKLSKKDDPYEMIKKKVDQSVADVLFDLHILGVGLRPEVLRYYPEREMASHVLGFVRTQDSHTLIGQYGIEGYYESILGGEHGEVIAGRDPIGRLMNVGSGDITQARDGADIILTIDKSLQYVACNKLKEALETYQADSATLVMVNPQTGAVLALCSYPSFDPNEYNKVSDVSYFNNLAIFDAYEPGSIFKPVTVAGALDKERITPQTVYRDTGSISYNNAGRVETRPEKIIHTLRNYGNKVHGEKTVTEILENSVNTGTVFTMQQLGVEDFRSYVRAFGFGSATGIELDTESAGNISSIDKPGEIFCATASFGQGITVTPLQMVMAYSVFANGGKLLKPYIVDEIRFPDGRSEKTSYPKVIGQPVTERTASLMTAMLGSVVDNGHAKLAGVPGYNIAGKTGTAQVAERGVYGEKTIQSFVGFGPMEDARFAMIIRLVHPRIGDSSAGTAARIFGDIATYVMEYYRIPPNVR